jgi:hypothetical protein
LQKYHSRNFIATLHVVFELDGRNHSEDLGIDGRILLESILRKWGWKGVDWMHPAQDRVPLAGSYEHGNKP